MKTFLQMKSVFKLPFVGKKRKKKSSFLAIKRGIFYISYRGHANWRWSEILSEGLLLEVND